MNATRRRTPRRLAGKPSVEGLESRQVLSGSPVAAATLAGGVDALATGDFNDDRTVDIAVAGRQAGHYVVTIYDGRGIPDSKSLTKTTFNVLATLRDPLGPGVGPLTIAVGDFAGNGKSDLAIAAAGATPGGAPLVKVLAPELVNPSKLPLDAPVKFVALGRPFAPAGLAKATGLQLAAADFDRKGADELAVAPAGGSAQALDILTYSPGRKSWGLAHQFDLKPLTLTGGVSLAAGALQADGVPELVLGSRRDGLVDVINPRTGALLNSFRPLGTGGGGVRVAAVPAVNRTGAIVVTALSAAAGAPKPVIVSAANWKAFPFRPTQSPGAGALVAFGGGWVYQRSTIVGVGGAFPHSDGPATPSVIFASTQGSTLIVQGSTLTGGGRAEKLGPSKLDAIAEPILARATADAPFVPLQEPGDLPGLTPAYATPAVAYPPTIVYHSPYHIDLSRAPASIYAGLAPTTPFKAPNNGGWGPQDPTSKAPTIPAGQGGDWLRERLLAAYGQAIGLAYQHHHDPYWQPEQGSRWNTVALGYQSQGVDCTNLTAFAYNDALGIKLNSATPVQAGIAPTNLTAISIPAAMTSRVLLQTI